ncbi:NAD-dependent epimerase/dehydratase family protein [Nocardia sp. CA-084685]|uniref:NAD-dependent epimerase/dehydratase family protein n=1 Tax=Nocardia sp. CA-084685 TaxID=3239970 RepID=UPI003D98F192
MTRALILGGTGVIGRAIALHLATAGWHVRVTGRNPGNMPSELIAAGVRFVAVDRCDRRRLHAVLGSGLDLLVDCVCYTGGDAHVLVELAHHATSTVLMSSKAVYVDAEGNHANSEIKPRFDGPLHESASVMPPGDLDDNSREGYGANKVAAENVALDSGLRISVLRPSLVHGIGARRPREWVFVKRVLDRRPAVLLANRGAGVIHTTAAANIAALVETVARRPGARILNIADPDYPTAAEISRMITHHLGYRWAEVPLQTAEHPTLGATPWDTPDPVTLDTGAAVALGYQPAGNYADTVRAQNDWLVSTARSDDPAQLLPQPDDRYFSRFFNYPEEDRYFAQHLRALSQL